MERSRIGAMSRLDRRGGLDFNRQGFLSSSVCSFDEYNHYKRNPNGPPNGINDKQAGLLQGLMQDTNLQFEQFSQHQGLIHPQTERSTGRSELIDTIPEDGSAASVRAAQKRAKPRQRSQTVPVEVDFTERCLQDDLSRSYNINSQGNARPQRKRSVPPRGQGPATTGPTNDFAQTFQRNPGFNILDSANAASNNRPRDRLNEKPVYNNKENVTLTNSLGNARPNRNSRGSSNKLGSKSAVNWGIDQEIESRLQEDAERPLHVGQDIIYINNKPFQVLSRDAGSDRDTRNIRVDKSQISPGRSPNYSENLSNNNRAGFVGSSVSSSGGSLKSASLGNFQTHHGAPNRKPRPRHRQSPTSGDYLMGSTYSESPVSEPLPEYDDDNDDDDDEDDSVREYSTRVHDLSSSSSQSRHLRRQSPLTSSPVSHSDIDYAAMRAPAAANTHEHMTPVTSKQQQTNTRVGGGVRGPGRGGSNVATAQVNNNPTSELGARHNKAQKASAKDSINKEKPQKQTYQNWFDRDEGEESVASILCTTTGRHHKDNIPKQRSRSRHRTDPLKQGSTDQRTHETTDPRQKEPNKAHISKDRSRDKSQSGLNNRNEGNVNIGKTQVGSTGDRTPGYGGDRVRPSAGARISNAKYREVQNSPSTRITHHGAHNVIDTPAAADRVNRRERGKSEGGRGAPTAAQQQQQQPPIYSGVQQQQQHTPQQQYLSSSSSSHALYTGIAAAHAEQTTDPLFYEDDDEDESGDDLLDDDNVIIYAAEEEDYNPEYYPDTVSTTDPDIDTAAPCDVTTAALSTTKQDNVSMLALHRSSPNRHMNDGVGTKPARPKSSKLRSRQNSVPVEDTFTSVSNGHNEDDDDEEELKLELGHLGATSAAQTKGRKATRYVPEQRANSPVDFHVPQAHILTKREKVGGGSITSSQHQQRPQSAWKQRKTNNGDDDLDDESDDSDVDGEIEILDLDIIEPFSDDEQGKPVTLKVQHHDESGSTTSSDRVMTPRLTEREMCDLRLEKLHSSKKCRRRFLSDSSIAAENDDGQSAANEEASYMRYNSPVTAGRDITTPASTSSPGGNKSSTAELTPELVYSHYGNRVVDNYRRRAASDVSLHDTKRIARHPAAAAKRMSPRDKPAKALPKHVSTTGSASNSDGDTARDSRLLPPLTKKPSKKKHKRAETTSNAYLSKPPIPKARSKKLHPLPHGDGNTLSVNLSDVDADDDDMLENESRRLEREIAKLRSLALNQTPRSPNPSRNEMDSDKFFSSTEREKTRENTMDDTTTTHENHNRHIAKSRADLASDRDHGRHHYSQADHSTKRPGSSSGKRPLGVSRSVPGDGHRHFNRKKSLSDIMNDLKEGRGKET